MSLHAPQPSGAGPDDAKGAAPDPRALLLLGECRLHQRNLSRAGAFAWERVVFGQALADPEPMRRIQAFLGEGK